ncbi:glycoside hydrolase superfamily [Fomes fomentarius]|nr:glycoside hydrolase superfamily [Fomes fomentarius]
MYDRFLGGTDTVRPFGSAMLDGRFDFDVEAGTTDNLDVFVEAVADAAANNPKGKDMKKYWYTAAPQCPFMNGHLQLDSWAKTSAKNKNPNVFVGAPTSQDAGAHYVTADQMGHIIAGTRNNYASFGGVMLWDAYAAKCRVKDVLLRSAAFFAWWAKAVGAAGTGESGDADAATSGPMEASTMSGPSADVPHDGSSDTATYVVVDADVLATITSDVRRRRHRNARRHPHSHNQGGL